MIQAKVVADSLNEFGNRLTTLEVVMPRIILAEFNTHRMLSRNSASSRAIPFHKLLEAVENNPFIPLKYMKDHKGMQGSEYFEDGSFDHTWLSARDKAVEKAKHLSELGLTKQIVNRLLEPFMWHTVLVSATEWENFFNLRYDSAAEIHMQEVAKVILEAMNESEPVKLKAGEWHIPYADKIIASEITSTYYWKECGDLTIEAAKIAISTAMCAGVSYTVVCEDGKTLNFEKLIARHDMLAKAGHMSPFEHIAKAMSYSEYNYNRITISNGEDKGSYIPGVCGNFRGFIQYRKMFQNENRADSRLIKKA